MSISRSRQILLLQAAVLAFSGAALADEKPLPIVRSVKATRQENLGLGHSFQDSAGQIWRNAENALLLWNGKKRSWEPTPVNAKAHPPWTARPSPPWAPWVRPLHVICGQEGSLLAVVIRDVYQDIPKKEWTHWSRIEAVGRERATKGGQPYWLEGWVYRDGKWSGPTSIIDLLRRERKFLLKAFSGQTATGGFCDLQSDGVRLWFSDGTKVHVLTSDGRTVSWKLPSPDQPRGPYHVNLLLLADGTMWCVYDRRITALLLRGARIEAKPVPEAVIPESSAHGPPSFHVAKDKTLWMWMSSYQGQGGDSFCWKGGRWCQREDVGLFALEDSDGGMWFLPGGGEGSWSWQGYNILKDGKIRRQPMPGEFHKGMLTLAGKDKLFAACWDRVFTIIRSDTAPTGWVFKSVVGLDDSFCEWDGVFADKHGQLVGVSGWSAPIPRQGE